MCKKITEEFVKRHGLTYEEYVNQLEPAFQRRYQRSYQKVALSEEQINFLKLPSRPVRAIVFTTKTCTDSVSAVPIMKKIQEHGTFIDLRVIDINKGDQEVEEVFENYTTNGDKRVPVIITLSEDYYEINRWVERSALGYKLYYESKRNAKDTDDFYKKVRMAFSENWGEIQNDSLQEIWHNLVKTITIVNTSSRLKKLSSN